MGLIVCQSCNQIIDFFESEKSTVLYGKCDEECPDYNKEQEE